MIESAVCGLLATWNKRLGDDHDAHYKEALGECIYELQSMMDNALYEEALEWENTHQAHDSLTPEELASLLADWEADSYLSSMEAHEVA